MKVLIAIDLLGGAQTLLDVVALRHWPEGSQLHILFVVEDTTGKFGRDNLRTVDQLKVFKEIAENRVMAAVTALQSRIPHATVLGEVLVGGVAEVIVNQASQIDADLIVLGHQGGYSQGAYSLGGVAERVVHSAPCSVIIVKPKIETKKMPHLAAQGASV